MTVYATPPAQLSIDARDVPGVRKSRIPDRETWLQWREATIGASEVPSLFGVHPHRSAFELYGVKTGAFRPEFSEAVIDDFSITLPPAEVGLWLEVPCFDLIRRIRPGWHVQPNPAPGGLHFVHEQHRASSTPDGFLYAEDRDGPGVVQLKTVAEPIFNKEWRSEDREVVPPLWVAVQTIMDATLSGCSWAFVGVLVREAFSARFHLYEIEVRPDVAARAFRLIDEFWSRVERQEPYEPDFAKDGAIIAALYADDGAPQVELTGERAERAAAILAEREQEKATEKAGCDAEKRRRALDAELVFMLGNASAASLPDGRVVTAKTTRRGEYTVKPTSYRTVKVLDPAASAKRVSGRRGAPALAAMPERF